MLSEREHESWDEIVRNLGAEPDGEPADPPAAIVGGIWGAVLLALFGVVPVAVAVGGLTALMWLLWRFLPRGARAPEEGRRAPEDQRTPRRCTVEENR